MGRPTLQKPVVLLKIGGKMAEEEAALRQFALDLKDLEQSGSLPVLVHGGGAEVSRLSRELGIEPVFHEGVRLTSPEEMDIVEMILCGRVGKRLVRLFQSCGLPAVGLSGADGRIFTGRSLGRILERETRTGNVEKVDTGLLEVLLGAGYFPVLASTTCDEAGVGVNINADTVAFELACALGSSSLVFLSDIPGVLCAGKVLSRLAREEVKERIRDGTITGGMIPKATAAMEALKKGVGRVVIGQYGGRGSLSALLAGGLGTTFEGSRSST
jgi:acetylglutamate kinase